METLQMHLLIVAPFPFLHSDPDLHPPHHGPRIHPLLLWRPLCCCVSYHELIIPINQPPDAPETRQLLDETVCINIGLEIFKSGVFSPG